MTTAEEQTKIPETISKTTVLVCLALFLFCGIIGFAFGADAGYNKGLQDCSQHHTIAPTILESP